MADEPKNDATETPAPETPAYEPHITIQSNDPADADLNKPPEEAPAEGEAKPDAVAAAGDEQPEAQGDEDDAGDDGQEASADDEGAAGDSSSKKPRRRFNRKERYQYALKRAYGAEQRARELERELEELKAGALDRTPPRRAAEEDEPRRAEPKKKAEPPKRDDFDDVEDYIVAKTKFEMAEEMENRLKAERVAIEARLVADRDRQAAQEAEEAEAQQLTDWQSKVDEFSESTPDFDTVIDANKDVPVSAPMRDFMIDSPVGPQMLYELAKDTDLAEEINSLPPLRALAAMGRLEARLNGGGGDATAPQPKPKPRLPKPPEPVGGGETAVSNDLENLPYDQYRKVMNEREFGRRAGR